MSPSPIVVCVHIRPPGEDDQRSLEQLEINKYTLYIHDYGGPVGFRIILVHPERVQALIIQNANAYNEGLGTKWAGIAQYWADPKVHPEVFDTFVSLAGLWWSGVGTIPRSSLLGQRRIDAMPDAEIHLLDAGHFALDEKNDEIASPHSRVLVQVPCLKK